MDFFPPRDPSRGQDNSLHLLFVVQICEKGGHIPPEGL
jgi:hypothetical protein